MVRRVGGKDAVLTVDIDRIELRQVLRLWDLKERHISLARGLQSDILHYYFGRYELPYFWSCFERVYKVVDKGSFVCEPKPFAAIKSQELFKKLTTRPVQG